MIESTKPTIDHMNNYLEDQYLPDIVCIGSCIHPPRLISNTLLPCK